MGTRGHRKMMKVIFFLEEGEVPDKKAEGWNIEGETRRDTKKDCKRLKE